MLQYCSNNNVSKSNASYKPMFSFSSLFPFFFLSGMLK